MTQKPRVRIPAGRAFAADSFQNLEARLGAGAGSMMDASGYALSNLITRQPRQLEYMYRGSWIVGAVVDAIADDMTQAGVDFGSAISPGLSQEITSELADLEIFQAVGDVIRWARLYGGAIGVLMIDGQDLSEPLRLDTIGVGQFRGILPLDRWSLVLTVDQVVTGMGPSLGRPEFYQVGPNAPAMVGQKIHHTRVIRQEGVRLPFVQRQAEQGWGLSVVERMYDRLLAYDSATTGAAQLVFKAYLRTLKVKGLTQLLAAGGPAMEVLIKRVEGIRRFQSTEGITLIDADDEFNVHTYTFAGLNDLLLGFGQQLSGATEIPLVRLFGQSPAGLNSTGESDTRNYYDSIKKKQERHLGPSMTRVLKVLHRSVTGKSTPENFTYSFNPLWQLSDDQKATVAKTTAEAVAGARDAGLISDQVAMKELKQSSDVTGIFTNISETDIAAAEATIPTPDVGEVSDPLSQLDDLLKPDGQAEGGVEGQGGDNPAPLKDAA